MSVKKSNPSWGFGTSKVSRPANVLPLLPCMVMTSSTLSDLRTLKVPPDQTDMQIQRCSLSCSSTSKVNDLASGAPACTHTSCPLVLATQRSKDYGNDSPGPGSYYA
jgi:hypothetical protein